MVSYCLSPGGHSGASLSSTAVKPGPGGEGGSSFDPNPPSKKEPEKSSVWALMGNPRLALFWYVKVKVFDFERKGLRQWEKEMKGGNENWESGLGQNGEFEEE